MFRIPLGSVAVLILDIFLITNIGMYTNFGFKQSFTEFSEFSYANLGKTLLCSIDS